MYEETEYRLIQKDSFGSDLDAKDIELLINSTFNNLSVEVEEVANDE